MSTKKRTWSGNSGRVVQEYYSYNYTTMKYTYDHDRPYRAGKSVVTRYEQASDNPTSGPPYILDTSFSLERWAPDKIGVMNGRTKRLGHYAYRFEDWIPRAIYGTKFGYQSYLPERWNEWVNHAIATINKSNSPISIANFLIELREVPRALRDIGRVLSGRARASDVPGGYLAYQFGWAPLVSDLRSLIALSETIAAINKSLTEASRRKAGGGSLGSFQNDSTWTDSSETESAGHIRFFEKLERRAWFSYKLSEQWEPPYDPSNGAAGVINALGLNQPMSVIWNALPWTFLFDYFVDVAGLLEAQHGFVKGTIPSICVMVHDRYHVDSTFEPSWLGHGVEFTPHRGVLERKQRRAFYDPRPTLSLAPYLTGRQMTNIGALILAGRLRRRG